MSDPDDVKMHGPPPGAHLYTRDGFVGAMAVAMRPHTIFEYASVDGPQAPRRLVLGNVECADATDASALPTVFANSSADVTMSVSRRTEPMPYVFRNVECDELHFVQEGELEYVTDWGTLTVGPGDFIQLGRTVSYRVNPLSEPTLWVIIETPEVVGLDTPALFAMVNAALDLKRPVAAQPPAEDGETEIWLKSFDGVTKVVAPHDPLTLLAVVDGTPPVWQLNLRKIHPVAYPTAGGPPAPFATTPSTDLMAFTLSSRPPHGRPPQHHNADFDELLFFFEGPGAFGNITEPGTLALIPKGVTHWGANENVPEGYQSWLVESRGTMRLTEAGLAASELMETGEFGLQSEQVLTESAGNDDELDGTFRKLDIGCEVQLDRQFDIPAERLWAMFTDKEELAQFIGGTVHDLELEVGGAMKIDVFAEAGAVATGNLTEFVDGSVIDMTWNVPEWAMAPELTSSMRWEIREDGDGSALLYTHTLPENFVDRAATYTAAAHLKLGVWVPLIIAGEPLPELGPPDVFGLAGRYNDKFFPKERKEDGAEVSEEVSTISRKVGALELPAPGVWKIDQAHSSLAFDCAHLTVARLRGTFTEFDGEFHIAETPEESSVEVTIQSKSLSMKSQMIVMALHTDAFVAVDAHPTLQFKSTGVRHVDNDLWEITGDLTIKGITREIVLDAIFTGVVATPAMMGSKAKLGFEVRGGFDRRDFGIEINMPLPGGGGWIVGNRVGIRLDIEADLVSLANA